MTKPAQFEKSIQALEQVVAALEKGDVSLDDALKQFEKGIQLTRTCQTLLTEAEQKIEQLMNQNSPKEDSTDG
ncbi:MAG: exodeoxyribonuclease VII small subunit [Gammaproteobacteria bacterium]|nr:exodeoxyribonuclease VII small subunit [Gammaproteobacteria bacterium]